jgi:hypothetical protein
MSQQNKFELNDLVQFAAQKDVVFKITDVRADGTFNIECCLDGQPLLSYEMIAQEMLRKIVQN